MLLKRRYWCACAIAVVTAIGCMRDFNAPFSEAEAQGKDGGTGKADAKPRTDGPTPPEEEEIPPGCAPAITLTSFDSPSSAWQLRGDAVLGGDAGPNSVTLVPPDFHKAGAVWWSVPLAIKRVVATFAFRSKGAGAYPAADGVVFAMVGGSAVPTVGAKGGSMGFCTLGGFGLALDMLPNKDGDIAPNLKVWAAPTDAGLDCATLAESPTLTKLTDGNVHDIRLTWDIQENALEAFVDTTSVLVANPGITLPPLAYAGFTAASGGYSGTFDIASPSISVTPPCER